MSSVSTPIKAFTPRKRLESDRLESLRAKVVQESSKLYKSPTSITSGGSNGAVSPYDRSSSTTISPFKNELSRFKHISTNSTSIKQEELNREHLKFGKSKLGNKYNHDTLPSIEWEHPELSQIEKRTVNKELETKRVMINVIFLLISNLVYNFIELLWKKLEIQYESHFNFHNILVGFQLLFIWNISTGLYKVLKPQDQFKDLNLTPHQRELLGLPHAPTTKTTPLEVIKPTRSYNANYSLAKSKISLAASPSKLPIKSSEPTSTTNTTPSQPSKKATTPIASPLASPVKSFSPKKSRSASISPIKAEPLQSNRLVNLKKQELSSTPTYIPSPKYYYRMDSPSRPRRRPL